MTHELHVARWCDWCTDDIERRADVGGCVLDSLTGEVRLYCKRCWEQEYLPELLEAEGYREPGAQERAKIEALMWGEA